MVDNSVVPDTDFDRILDNQVKKKPDPDTGKPDS